MMPEPRSPEPQPRLPAEEPDAEATLGIVFHLLRVSREERDNPNWESKVALLMADYRRRSAELAPELQQQLDRAVVRSYGPGRRDIQLSELVRTRPTRKAVDVAIVNVLPEELSATLYAFGLRDEPHPGQPFHDAQVPCRGRPGRDLSVVITAAAQPLTPHIGPAVAALRERYSPSAAFLVGIAGGRGSRVRRGDVIVCQRVYYYGAGRQTTPERIDPRPQVAEPRNLYGNGLYSYDPQQTTFHARTGSFLRSLKSGQRPSGLESGFRPTVHRGHTTIASGDLVFRDGRRLEEIAQHDDTIRAADQESYGFSQAVSDLPWAVFRGISDVADPEQDDRWKYVSAGLAAICLRDFLETYFVPPDVADL